MCNHETLVIIEIGSWETQHYRRPNGEWDHNNEPGAYQTMIEVRCKECRLNRKYSKYKLPIWLQKYVAEIGL